MNKLINKRQTLKDIYHKVSEQERNAIQGEDLDVGVIVGLKMAMRIVKEQPSAEKTGKWAWPSVAKTAEWIESTESCMRPFMCSNCGCIYDVDTFMGEPVWNHCPHCGARMVNDNE